ncbi:MAG TPA: hypothetical protein VGD79_12630 [Thermoanaerobaculia bacterium]|jgi:hypothetical protein
MTRWSVLALVLFVGCASSRSTPPPPDVDPVTEPTIVGAITEGALQGTEEGEAAARVGRRVGRVAGVVAAVFGGGEVQSDTDIIDRYRRTRDAVTITAAAIGATHGAVEGVQRGLEFDQQFAELTKIEGITATRPMPDLIVVELTDRSLLPQIAAVLAGREERAIDVAGEAAFEVRDTLIDLGVPSNSMRLTGDDADGIVLLISL